jgi:signal transduction histidine kinase
VSAWWRPQSVRTRLTLWYVAVMAIVLIAFSIGLYGLMKHSLDEQFEVFDRAVRHGQPPPETADIPDAELHELFIAILIGLPIALVVSAIGGYSLARRALRPIEQISAQADTISAERLGRRLPIDNPGDELGHLARVLNDLLARLETSFEQMRRFTADASHELRTPLTAIRSVGEGALRGHRIDPASREVIGSMLEEVERLTTLVDALLRPHHDSPRAGGAARSDARSGVASQRAGRGQAPADRPAKR